MTDPVPPEDKGHVEKILKYFELPIMEVRKWTWKDYAFFIIESLYSTILPFLAGALLVRQGKLYWLLFMVLPIYLRLTIVKNLESKIKRRLYLK